MVRGDRRFRGGRWAKRMSWSRIAVGASALLWLLLGGGVAAAQRPEARTVAFHAAGGHAGGPARVGPGGFGGWSARAPSGAHPPSGPALASPRGVVRSPGVGPGRTLPGPSWQGRFPGRFPSRFPGRFPFHRFHRFRFFPFFFPFSAFFYYPLYYPYYGYPYCYSPYYGYYYCGYPYSGETFYPPDSGPDPLNEDY